MRSLQSPACEVASSPITRSGCGRRQRASAYEEHAQLTPQPGWVEHDPEEIWQKTVDVIRGALGQAGLADGAAGRLAAVGVTNQRETSVLWDRRTGRPLYRAIVWQDTRTRDACRALIDRGLEPSVRARTGLPVATYFSALKAAWILDHVPGVRAHAERGDVCFGTMDSWVIWWLTGGPAGGVHVTDATNASRTLLMNLHTRTWDDELLGIFRIPRAAVPEIRLSSDRYGATVPVRSAPPCPSARTWAINRPRSSGRPAAGPAMRRTPTAPAASCSSTPATGRCRAGAAS